jgi:hypothetical protein
MLLWSKNVDSQVPNPKEQYLFDPFFLKFPVINKNQ